MTRHTIEASEKPLSEIFCDKYLFRIPSYQRPYAWTTEQVNELFDDLVTAWGNTADAFSRSPYFLGSLVLIKEQNNSEADVVDGQQRLTTITMLFAILRDNAEDLKVKEAIHQYVCQAGNPIANLKDVFRLNLRERDSDCFCTHIQQIQATINLPDPRTFKDAQARIIENAYFIRSKVKEFTAEQLKHFTIFIANRCFLVVVAASDQNSAFRIFSVMNSRGLDLLPADIFKADIIGAVPQKQREKYNSIWEDLEGDLGRSRFSELFGHIRMIHRKQKLERSLIAEFRDFVPIKDPIAFIDNELYPYASAFDDLLKSRFESYKHSDLINRQIRYLLRLDNFDWQPPVIEVFAKRKSDPDYILRFLKDLERLAYGMFITRQDVNTRVRRYGRVLAAMQSDADLSDESKSPLQLTQEQIVEIKQNLDGDIYNTRIRLPLLLRLDEILSNTGAVYDHHSISVEHVLPQNPKKDSSWYTDFPKNSERERWTHRLAKLVLLTRRKNAYASNYEFNEKKERYFAPSNGVTNFGITAGVLRESTWTPDVLSRRQNDFISLLSNHWRL